MFNFAQGAIVVAGTYLVYLLLVSAGFALVPALVLNVLIGMALGIACELITVRPLRIRGRAGGQQNELVTTVGMATMIVGLIGIKWGYNPLLVPFHGPQATVHFLGIIAAPVEITLLRSAIVLAIVLHLWFHATRWGQACLAVAEDREAATLRGINVNLLSLGGFAAAGALGTATAFAIGPVTYAIPTLANTIALGGFVAIALGRSGQLSGGPVWRTARRHRVRVRDSLHRRQLRRFGRAGVAPDHPAGAPLGARSRSGGASCLISSPRPSQTPATPTGAAGPSRSPGGAMSPARP